MNTILKIIEELDAMRAQYTAAQAIGGLTVRPAKPVKKNKKTSYHEDQIFKNETIKLALNKVTNTKTLQFADLADDEDEEPEYASSIKFIDSPESGLQDPYAANREDMELLEKVYQAHNYLSEAIEIHNTIHGLSSYQDIAEAYVKAKKVHKKAIIEDRKSVV